LRMLMPCMLRCCLLVVLQAALCCEPLSAADRVALAEGLQALPLKQLEAALGLVLPRMAPALLAGGVGSNGSEVGGLRVFPALGGGLEIAPGGGGGHGLLLVARA
jgi:hypothetical protein